MIEAPAIVPEIAFNSAQAEAIQYDAKRYLILAGAGTGKTETLTERVVHFICHKGINPNQVLMFTYTNKAANNMSQRIQKKLPYPNMGVLSGTFHSISYRLLREHVFAMEVLPTRQVVAEHHATKLRREAAETVVTEDATAKSLLDECGIAAADLLEVYERKTKLNLTQHFLNNPREEIRKRLPELTQLARRLSAQFDQLKAQYQVIDFNDILFKFHWVLQNYPIIRDHIRHLYRHLYVDEYQDTNRIQVEILKLMLDEESYLTVVGDDTQSIYSFQGSEVQNIRNFHLDFPSSKNAVLNENYRSSPPIVTYTNAVNATCIGAMPKTLVSRGPQVDMVPQSYVFETAEKEAEWVVGEVLRLMHREHISPHEIAILTRIGSIAQHVEGELQKEGIAYARVGGIKLIDLKHIQFFITFLELLENPKNWLAWETVLPMIPNIGEHYTQVIIKDLQANEGNWSWEQPPVFSIGRGKRFDSVMHFWRDLWGATQIPKQESVRFYLEELLPHFQKIYARYYYCAPKMMQLSSPGELPEKIEDHIQDIRDYIISLSTSYIGLVKDFIDQVMVSQDEKEIRRGITLSTIHSAKGLEWQAVFVIGNTQNVFPSPGYGLELNDLEEERRLFYVACTRAKTHLYLTTANRYPRVKGETSPFVLNPRTKPYLHCMRDTGEQPFRVINPHLFSDYTLRIPLIDPLADVRRNAAVEVGEQPF